VPPVVERTAAGARRGARDVVRVRGRGLWGEPCLCFFGSEDYCGTHARLEPGGGVVWVGSSGTARISRVLGPLARTMQWQQQHGALPGRTHGATWSGRDKAETRYVRTHRRSAAEALFSSKKFCKIGIVTLLFVFDKYYSIMD